MKAAYRDDEYGAQLALDALLEQRRAEIAAVPPAVHLVYSRRVARSVAGVTAIGAAVLIALMACCAPLDSSFHLWSAGDSTSIFGHGNFTCALLLAWVAVAGAYLAGRLLADARLRRALDRDMQPSGDVHADLARLEQTSPREGILHLVHARERQSLALPLAGLMLLAPVTLHFVVYLGVQSMKARPGEEILAEFNGWIIWSVFLTGLAHAALASMAFRYARRLSETPTSLLGTSAAPGIWSAYGLTVAASIVPGIIAFCVPPVLVALTGLITIPGPFAAFRRRLIREREALSVGGAGWA